VTYKPETAIPFIEQAANDAWRGDALAQLKTRGLPTPKLERWKYTNLAGFVQSGAKAAVKTALNTNPIELPWTLQTSRKFVFVNGFLALGDARLSVAKNAPEFNAAPMAQFDDGMLWALNTALAADGPHVTITENNSVFEIIHIGQGVEVPQLASAHSIFKVAANVSATIIEQYVGLGKTPVHSNGALEIVLESGANLNHIRLQTEREGRTVLNTTHVTVARDATYNATFLNMGAGLSRQEFWVELNEPGASCTLKGVQLMADEQHMDTTILIDHKAPHCASNQTIRNVLSGDAYGVFQGKIHVHRPAQKTDGYQLCNTLMLSDRAQMNTKPELEIYADDVKCSHGTTTGKLDETALFYLRARGIPEAQAKQMLLKAFIDDLFTGLPDYVLAHVEEHVEGWLENV
jgi:Fe-S cluster assembly protein SufD